VLPSTVKVNLTKRVRLGDGTTRFYPVVEAANGRIKADYVLIDGKQVHYPTGAFYIDWNAGKKRIRKSVGTNAAQAVAKQYLQEGILAAKNAGVENVPALPDSQGKSGRLLVHRVAVYLDGMRLTRKPRSYNAYKNALNYFIESCSKQTLEELERADMLKFTAYLRDTKDQSDRSVRNKFEHVMSFLKTEGIRGLVGKSDWPKYTEEEVEVYEQQELDSLFAVCDAKEKLWWRFFLMTGMREAEVMHTYWSDVNLDASTVKVSAKRDRGWTPKTYSEREIPIPTTLAESLKEWKEQATPGCPLLFPTSGCNVKMNFLDDLKAAATRAKLNPDNCWLHKFRATFATWSLWAGVDLRTVQQWLGHSDIQSTMRYLKPQRSHQVRDKVNTIFVTFD
jgi:integrase/recombinase XerD